MKETAQISIPGFSLDVKGLTHLEVVKKTPIGDSSLFKMEYEPADSKGVMLVVFADKVEMQQDGVPGKDIFS